MRRKTAQFTLDVFLVLIGLGIAAAAVSEAGSLAEKHRIQVNP
jgi:hypothetical protein